MDLNQLKNLQTKLRSLNQSRIEQDFKQEILDNSSEIVALVRNRWKQGKRPNGNIIGRYQNYGYQLIKQQQNPLAGGNVDLILDGGLNRGLVVNHLRGSLFNIFSTDDKAVSIAEKYGLDVYGLTKDEENDVLIEATDRVLKKHLQYLGLWAA